MDVFSLLVVGVALIAGSRILATRFRTHYAETLIASSAFSRPSESVSGDRRAKGGYMKTHLSKTVLTAIVALAVCLLLINSQARADSLANGLVGYWTGNGNALDSSPIGNNGSFAGSYAEGLFGQLAFNVGTGPVVIPDVPAYSFENDPGWTISFWFDGNPGTFVGQDDGAGELPKWFIDYGYANPGPSDTFIEHFNNYGSDPRVFLASDPVAFPSGWNELAVVNTPDEVTFYLNGTDIGSDAYSGGFPDPTADLEFGYLEPCCQYGGLLQDIGIWSVPLAPAEIEELASGVQPFDTPPPANTPEPGTASLILIGFGLLHRRLIKRGNGSRLVA
jgi:hypothetical protein